MPHEPACNTWNHMEPYGTIPCPPHAQHGEHGISAPGTFWRHAWPVAAGPVDLPLEDFEDDDCIESHESDLLLSLVIIRHGGAWAPSVIRHFRCLRDLFGKTNLARQKHPLK